MKIAHLCLSNWFIEGFGYQENELIREHVKGGHEVIVLASTEIINSSGHIVYVKPGEFFSQEGARVVRLPYTPLVPSVIMKKVRSYPGVMSFLEHFTPDIIFFHGASSLELLTVANYVRKYPQSVLYVDNHGDWNNSARNFLSRELLHRRFYGLILRQALPEIQKILCVSTESIDFCHDLYGIPLTKLEFFPLGGHPLSDNEYIERRIRTRRSLLFDDENIVFIQSGKQTARKKLLETLRAFLHVQEPRNRLIVVGVLAKDIEAESLELINQDNRISYLGWASLDQLTDLLCGADIYVQPGTQSVTMQHSMCCRCAVAIDDVKAHKSYYCQNGWLLNSQITLDYIFRQAVYSDIEMMKKNSHSFAKCNLDYKILAQKILS